MLFFPTENHFSTFIGMHFSEMMIMRQGWPTFLRIECDYNHEISSPELDSSNLDHFHRDDHDLILIIHFYFLSVCLSVSLSLSLSLSSLSALTIVIYLVLKVSPTVCLSSSVVHCKGMILTTIRSNSFMVNR